MGSLIRSILLLGAALTVAPSSPAKGFPKFVPQAPLAVILAVPSHLIARGITEQQINLRWVVNGKTEQGYIIERFDNSLPPNTICYYRVRAYSYTLGHSGSTEDAHGTVL